MESARRPERWTGDDVRALRESLGVTQAEFARMLGVRQQTVSEWETGAYQPRGASGRMLGRIADDAGYVYDPRPRKGEG